jgi:hypothetical protein
MNRLLRAAIVIAIQLGVSFVVLEVAGRALDPLGISYYPETARFYDDLELGGPLGYRLPARMRGDYWGTSVETNFLGMRDREVGAKTPGEYRVMLLGDSVIFSLGVEYEDSIPYRLEQLLNETAPPGRHYRVLNMGVPSYNTEQELTQLETVGLGLQPDAVALMFVPNDLEKKMWVYERRGNPVANLAQRSYAASLLFVLARQVGGLLRSSATVNVDEPIAEARAGSDASGAVPAAADVESGRGVRWRAVDTALTRMADLLRSRGIPFLVVSRGEVDDAHLRVLRTLSAQRGFGFDVLDAEADPHRAADPGSLIISATNSHCNARGCEAIARSLQRLLQAHGLVPTAPADL